MLENTHYMLLLDSKLNFPRALYQVLCISFDMVSVNGQNITKSNLKVQIFHKPEGQQLY